jgi:hypothetical protein
VNSTTQWSSSLASVCNCCLKPCGQELSLFFCRIFRVMMILLILTMVPSPEAQLNLEQLSLSDQSHNPYPTIQPHSA